MGNIILHPKGLMLTDQVKNETLTMRLDKLVRYKIELESINYNVEIFHKKIRYKFKYM